MKVEIKLLWLLPPTMTITIVLCSYTELNRLRENEKAAKWQLVDREGKTRNDQF
jgi:hypothetical protein